jgi:nucleoside-diphosphate-sugar epimerase
MRVLIVGCGYVGMAVGADLAKHGHEVFGLRRSARAQGDLESLSITPLAGDVTELQALAKLPIAYAWVVNCVASTGGGAEEYRRVYLQGAQNLIEWLSPDPPKKFVYTSSTSVYAQNDGSIVTESSPAVPTAETARVLRETEEVLLKAAKDRQFPAVILRVAGIYGPERGFWFKQFLAGEARIEGRGERVLNMIHRDDVAGAIIAALEQGKAGEIYNAVDDEPVSQLDLFRWLSGKLGKEMPPIAAEGEGVGRKRGVTSKRVSNRKIKAELGYQFKYPNFRCGYGCD